jgi:hypothetical protein
MLSYHTCQYSVPELIQISGHSMKCRHTHLLSSGWHILKRAYEVVQFGKSIAMDPTHPARVLFLHSDSRRSGCRIDTVDIENMALPTSLEKNRG